MRARNNPFDRFTVGQRRVMLEALTRHLDYAEGRLEAAADRFDYAAVTEWTDDRDHTFLLMELCENEEVTA